MELKELSINDLSALMAYFSRKMSKVQEKTPENTKEWEKLAFKRGCCSSEFERRVKEINFPDFVSKNI